LFTIYQLHNLSPVETWPVSCCYWWITNKKFWCSSWFCSSGSSSWKRSWGNWTRQLWVKLFYLCSIKNSREFL